MPRRDYNEEDDAVALRELPSELERHDDDDNGHQNRRHASSSENGHESDSHVEAETQARQRRESRKRALVLVGSAISQLPIWGFAMNYGIFQEYYASTPSATGIIGTTSNGVLYLSMPPLFLLLTARPSRHHRLSLARRRRLAALLGILLSCAAFLLASAARHVWHLVAAQGVLAALGAALLYSPLTLSLGECFSGGHNRNRAVAYGLTLSCKNVVGSACPFLLRALLDRCGFRATMWIWTGVTAVTSILAVALTTPMHFLRHATFYIYAIAIALQSSGYGIPQTYLNTYAHDVAHLSQTTATLLLTVFNGPGIIASLFFGYLTDNKRFPCPPPPRWPSRAGSMALLVVFSATFGFFAGGYSATWGGVINELEGEAARRNEAIDTGLVYGLLNGARGVGYVSGGLVGVPLLKAGSGALSAASTFGYGTSYGPLIIFTGISSLFGGWGLLWKGGGQAV
ncbi:hypothetical protein ACCO45_012930 [Purpureocillium lilacinum]|uniref:Uncharacterized protein n=1 Tax=Purpureocillium lilacinum TaxID=33203 RepID=A0ACC4D9E4_PURLI